MARTPTLAAERDSKLPMADWQQKARGKTTALPSRATVITTLGGWLARRPCTPMATVVLHLWPRPAGAKDYQADGR